MDVRFPFSTKGNGSNRLGLEASFSANSCIWTEVQLSVFSDVNVRDHFSKNKLFEFRSFAAGPKTVDIGKKSIKES